MGNSIKQAVAMVLALSLIVVTLVLGYEMILFSETYFQWHYTHREIDQTTGINQEELGVITDQMLNYLKGQRKDLAMEATIHGEKREVFSQREKDHMVDVQKLYMFVRRAKWIGLLLILLINSIGILWNKKAYNQILGWVKYWVLGYLVVIGAIGGLLATNFEKYFTLGHELIFTNDLWLLDPSTDVLIQMVPESYFYSIVVIGLGLFLFNILIGILLVHFERKWLEGKIKKVGTTVMLFIMAYSLIGCTNQVEYSKGIQQESVMEQEEVSATQVVQKEVVQSSLVEQPEAPPKSEEKEAVLEEEAVDEEVILGPKADLSKEAVMWLQESLKIAGFYTHVDGDFGQNTQNQLEAFNKAYAIEGGKYTEAVKEALEAIRIKKLAPNFETDQVLINKNFYLPLDFEPENLREVQVAKNKSIQLPDHVASQVEALFAAAQADGHEIYLASGYRSYLYQQNIFTRRVNRKGFEEAQTVVAIPGQSEHQTGLAIDITNQNMAFKLSTRFDQEEEFEWMMANCYKYGFILRYRKDKEAMTTYIYEPWHYRYIGDVEMAKYIMDNELVLEEYMADQ